MKKNSNRQVKDYNKYSDEQPEYYGLLKKNGRVRVDVRRMAKTFFLDEEIFNEVNKPRKTVYFVPYKIHFYDYMINIFKRYIESMQNMWKNEILPIIEMIKTPGQVGEEARTGYFMQTGIMDMDECSILGWMANLARGNQYEYVIKSLISQFVHQYMSGLESVTIEVLTLNGYKEETFKRSEFNSFVQGYQAKTIVKDKILKLEDLNSYRNYDKMYKVWNFLKHNSLDLYKKMVNNYPEMLLKNQKFSHGKQALSVLKIDFDYIESIFTDSLNFFEELCEKIFNENLFYTKWNYDSYFESIINNHIDLINNPLGLPPWT
ncbi:MAG: hypothetical protein AB7V16_12830 [Vulcanibacillus sp.]